MERFLVVAALALVPATASSERLRAPNGEVVEVPDASVEFAIKDGYKRLGVVMFRDESGTVRRVYDEPSAIAYARQRGWWRMTDAEVAAERVKDDERNRARYDEMVKEANATPTHIKVFVGVLMLVGLFVAIALYRDFVLKPKKKVE